jgi:hypothetical protein
MEEISVFAKERKVSRSLVAYRLFLMEQLSKASWNDIDQRLKQEWRERKSPRNGGAPSYYVVRRHKVGAALLSLVHRSLRDGILSPTKAGKILGVNPRRVETMLKEFAS